MENFTRLNEGLCFHDAKNLWVTYYVSSTWLSNLRDNLVQTPGKLEFTLKNTDSDNKLVFVPHYSRYKDRYGIYWKLAGTAGGSVSPPACP